MANQLEFRWDDSTPHGGARTNPERAAKAAAPIVEEFRRLQAEADALRSELEAGSGLQIFLRVTNNSSTMLSIRYERNNRTARVGLHKMFLASPEDVRKALVAWVKNPRGRKSGGVLDAFIRAHTHEIATREKPAARKKTNGACHDLQRLFDEVNREYFGSTVTAAITWGLMPRVRRRRRSIRFGSYCPRQHLVRIHPLLDQKFVPEFFVRYIVFHEMLHAHLGIDEGCGGRRLIHPPRFREAEERYPDYNRALKWMETPENIGRLLRARTRP